MRLLATLAAVVVGVFAIAGPPAAARTATTEEMRWARSAWAYVARNTDPTTGLVSAVEGFPSTTLWDVGSSLLAMIAAERLGVIGGAEFDARMGKALDSLAGLPLFDGRLPNKAYDTRSLVMADYDNNPVPHGIGWSVLDICRALVPLRVLERDYPHLAPKAAAVIGRWDLQALVADGELRGSGVNDGQTVYWQEGRHGYEQYGAKGAFLAGLSPYKAIDLQNALRFVTVEGVRVPIDVRDPETYVAPVVATSEPWLLMGLEFGWNAEERDFAGRVQSAQRERWARTGVLTAVSEGHIDRAPWFVYGSVHGNGADWSVVTLGNLRHDGLRFLSTKAAFGWDTLVPTPYTRKLMGVAARLARPDGGFLEGRYEAGNAGVQTLTANTNAVVLEAIHYRVRGPMVSN